MSDLTSEPIILKRATPLAEAHTHAETIIALNSLVKLQLENPNYDLKELATCETGLA